MYEWIHLVFHKRQHIAGISKEIAKVLAHIGVTKQKERNNSDVVYREDAQTTANKESLDDCRFAAAFEL